MRRLVPECHAGRNIGMERQRNKTAAGRRCAKRRDRNTPRQNVATRTTVTCHRTAMARQQCACMHAVGLYETPCALFASTVARGVVVCLRAVSRSCPPTVRRAYLKQIERWHRERARARLIRHLQRTLSSAGVRHHTAVPSKRHCCCARVYSADGFARGNIGIA